MSVRVFVRALPKQQRNENNRDFVSFRSSLDSKLFGAKIYQTLFCN